MLQQTHDRLMGFAKALEGISYPEWVKLTMAMETYFIEKKREREEEIRLTHAEEFEKAIRSRFE